MKLHCKFCDSEQEERDDRHFSTGYCSIKQDKNGATHMDNGEGDGMKKDWELKRYG